MCTAEYDNIHLLRPLNKSVTKLVNLTHDDCRGMPIYKREGDRGVTRVKMFSREEVQSGNYLFVVQYLQWRPDCTHPLGIVVKTLPKGSTAEHSFQVAKAEYGVRPSFRGAEKEVQRTFPISWVVPEEEYCRRQRVIGAFTIDHPESMDLDDALSVQSTQNGSCRVGIHIADVSFFVTPGSKLDDEAQQRCTSYYPGEGRESIPMIPRRLSEKHCSLLPQQDRLAVSVFLLIDEQGKVVDRPAEICRTIVNSCCRLDYSQAQALIDQHAEMREFPEDVVTGVRILNGIAQQRLKARLADGADSSNDGDVRGNVEAHELVQELMILANKTIAEYLMAALPELAPLRSQLPPKEHRMHEWLQTNARYLGYLHAVRRCMNVVRADADDSVPVFKIHRGAWLELRSAAAEEDMAKARRVMQDERNQPQVAAAHAQFRRIQARSRYQRAGDQPAENARHYSLGVSHYTHFTSPIRRYADILVHRLVLQVLETKKAGPLTEEEVDKICRRCTFYQANASKFSKTCRKIKLADKLKSANQEVCVIVESIEEGCLRLHIADAAQDLLGGREKKLKIGLLSPLSTTQPEGEEAQCIELKLKFRMYFAPTRETAKKISSKRKEDGAKFRIPKTEVITMLKDVLTKDYDPVDISGEKWLKMMEAVESDDAARLISIIDSTDVDTPVVQASPSGGNAVNARTKEKGAIYRHPHYGEKPTGADFDEHFYDVNLVVRQYDSLHVQLGCHVLKGVLSPDLQLLKLTKQVSICLEHQKYPLDCFATTARHYASRAKYGSAEEYRDAWVPVLAMEAATEAVDENDNVTIAKLEVTWVVEEGKTIGRVDLPESYCDSRQLEFYPGDLICIRARYGDCAGRSTGGSSRARPIQEDSVAACDGTTNHSRSMRSEKSDGTKKDVYLGSTSTDVWVGHCILEEVVEKKRMIKLAFRLHQASSDVPKALLDGKPHSSMFEVIHRTLPQR